MDNQVDVHSIAVGATKAPMNVLSRTAPREPDDLWVLPGTSTGPIFGIGQSFPCSRRGRFMLIATTVGAERPWFECQRNDKPTNAFQGLTRSLVLAAPLVLLLAPGQRCQHIRRFPTGRRGVCQSTDTHVSTVPGPWFQ